MANNQKYYNSWTIWRSGFLVLDEKSEVICTIIKKHLQLKTTFCEEAAAKQNRMEGGTRKGREEKKSDSDMMYIICIKVYSNML